MSDENFPNQLQNGGRKLSRKDFLRIATATGLAGAIAMKPQSAGAAPKTKTNMDPPVLSCGTQGSDYIDIQVCAGASGAPAGFSIQWMKASDFTNGTACNLAGQWPSNSDNILCVGVLCKASFSGNASLSNYNLAAGQCVTVRIGEILLDSGASTTCPDRLICGAGYVFRAFAHANSTLQRSDFTSTLLCSTASCGDVGCDPCVKSFGFYKQHYPGGWPAVALAGLTVGCQNYTADQLQAILLSSPAGGLALVALAHQVINTRLNLLCSGVSQAYIDAVSALLTSAEALMCTTGAVPPIGSGSLTGAQVGGLTTALDTARGLFECP